MRRWISTDPLGALLILLTAGWLLNLAQVIVVLSAR
jgi:hypothetical protein